MINVLDLFERYKFWYFNWYNNRIQSINNNILLLFFSFYRPLRFITALHSLLHSSLWLANSSELSTPSIRKFWLILLFIFSLSCPVVSYLLFPVKHIYYVTWSPYVSKPVHFSSFKNLYDVLFSLQVFNFLIGFYSIIICLINYF